MGEVSPRAEATKSHKRSNGNEVVSPPQKRQRVYVACEHCRLRKQKCDSKRPACSTCIATNQQCVYGAGVKKRGLPPGYVRVLETLFGLIFTKITNGEEAVAGLLLSSGVVTRQWALGKADDSSDIVLQRFKKSNICRNIERLLEGEARDSGDTKPPLNPVMSGEVIEQLDWKGFCSGNNGHEQNHLGSPSQREGLDLPATAIGGENSRATQALQLFHLSLEVQAPLYAEFLSKSPAWLRANAIHSSSLNLRLPENTWTLLDIYFTWTNCWLPIIQRQEILKTFHSYESANVQVNPASPDAGKHAILWAIIAHASFQDRATKSEKEEDSSREVLSCQQLYETAKSLVPPYLPAYERGHVQALMLMSMINCGSGQKMLARELIGRAAQVAEQIGLGKDYNTSVQRESRFESVSKDEGTMLGCFVIATLVSYGLEHPSHFDGQGIAGSGIMDTDRLEEYESWFNRTKIQGSSLSEPRRGPQHSITLFNQLTKIIRILHKYQRAAMEQPSNVSPETASLAFQELQNWHFALPSTCQMSVPMSETQKLQITPQLLNLHIIYHFVTTTCTEISDASPAPASIGSDDARNYTARSHLATLLLAYNDIFGCTAMPPMFSQITKSACHWQGLLQPSSPGLQETLARLHRTWREEVDHLPVMPRHIQEQIDLATTMKPYFLQRVGQNIPITENSGALIHNSPPAARHPSVIMTSNPSVEREQVMDNYPPQAEIYQRTSVSQQASTTLDLLKGQEPKINEVPLSTYAHITVPEDTLYPISPMSIDTTFKRPDQPASASARVFTTDFLHTHHPYQQQMASFEHAAHDFTSQGRTQQQTIYDPQHPGQYNSASSMMDTNSLLGSNYDLDQLFNDLAPLDQGDSQPAFMMNLGISGDPGFDLDAFFA